MNISVSRNGVEIGQWPEEEIQTLLDEGKLLPTDYYWMQGMTEWEQIAMSIKPPPPADSVPAVLDEEPKVGMNRLAYFGIISLGLVVACCVNAIAPPLGTLIWAPAFIVSTWRRLKNIGYTPYYTFLLLIPGVNVCVVLVCLLQSPDSVMKSPNKLWYNFK